MQWLSFAGYRYYYQNYEGAYRPPISLEQPQPPRRGFNFPQGHQSTPVQPAASTPQIEDRHQRKSKCEGSHVFRQVRSRTRLRSGSIKRSLIVASLFECEQVCLEERQFQCFSFNFMPQFQAALPANCDLSHRDLRSLDLNDPTQFEISEDYDFYARDTTRSLDACIDVSQECSTEGMIFTLRTQEGFRGRIYTYKHFDESPCYVRGTGGLTHRLRIPNAQAFPNCGTENLGGDTETNIVVIQTSELVQTSKDMIYNLTCKLQSPGQSVVSSGYIGAGSGEPRPIEYLPAEHTIDSKVKLVIEYKGRETTTIAVGDQLKFKLQTQGGTHLVQDIFATDVIAKDPYTQRTIELIDANGCPVDPSVFPGTA